MGSEWCQITDLALTKSQLELILPLGLALWMGWWDIRTMRIPNYLTFGGALAGLVFQVWFAGWSGLADGFLGLGLGFALLILFYWKGGLGAGDVKALAALGAWLGPLQTLHLFIYMAFSGLLLIIIVLWWRGLLWGNLKSLWGGFLNMLLLRPYHDMPAPTSDSSPASAFKLTALPYAVAMAMGMAILCGRAFLG